MALPTNTATTYSQVGIREELDDVIYDITPAETPFLSSIEQETVENTLFEWQTHELNAVSKAGALDGDDAPQDAYVATVLRNNRTHIRTRDARVSGSARAMNTAGRADDLDYQILNRGIELKRDMEASSSGTWKPSCWTTTPRSPAPPPRRVRRLASCPGSRPTRTAQAPTRRVTAPTRQPTQPSVSSPRQDGPRELLGQRRQPRHGHGRRLQQAGDEHLLRRPHGPADG
jgi:hypothetical protein